ncbi:hypothetical protein EC957_002320 [Mortierella hygrophila]|uniref:Chromatin structure-remodeling complex protein RSC7 n=1 Tax=Mortierella hygrophila TaxID=979708 RepID=A0A9P6F5C8_9FUNG|nr:hypothetical protein EC957_002320 [Mortierella hygrophila]
MAPSLPGSSGGRRGGARGSMRASSQTVEKQDSDSEDVGSNSPSRSKRPSRQAAPRPRGRPPKVQQLQQEEEEEEEEEEEDVDGMEVDDKENSQGPIGDEEEIEGEMDEVGETKVTKDGELLGGRQYRCRSFKLPERGDRIYMLSMDPARVLGFRDSYLFFLKNPQLVRVNTTVEERQWMIEQGMLMANFKSKLIAVVTARSIFKSFGAKIIKGGKSRVDDYFESSASEDAVDDSEGDTTSRTGDDNTQSGSTGGNYQAEDHPSPAPSKRKHTLMHEDSARQITDLNWQYESAMAVRALNSRLKELRKENPKFLDPHTNIEQIPAITQPTRCDVHVVHETAPSSKPQVGEAENEEGTVLSIPRSIGPHVATNVKVEIKPGAPLPPLIHDPNVWAAIPEDIRRVLEEAEIAQARDYDENDEVMTRFPISLLTGQYQAAYPLHQTRFQRPYNIVLPQGMTAHAHYIRHLWSTQPHPEPVLMEQTTRPGTHRPSQKKSIDQQPPHAPHPTMPHHSQQQPPPMQQHQQQHQQQQPQSAPYQYQSYPSHPQQHQHQHAVAPMPIQPSNSRRR